MINFRRLVKSHIYAFKGLAKTFREEQNLRVQTVAGSGAIILALLFRISRGEWLVLIFSITLVLLMEVVNSAMERVADVLKPRIDTYVKEVKDIMAAAVLLASISAAIIGLIIFLPYIRNFLL